MLKKGNNQAMMRRLHGLPQSNGKVQQFQRGKPVYRGGRRSAHSGGGPQFGRPQEKTASMDAIRRRLKR